MLPELALLAAFSSGGTVAGPLHPEPGERPPRRPQTAVVAPPADSGDWSPPEELALEIRRVIGRRWGADAGRIRLEWGPVRTEWRETTVTDFRILGSGDSGSWVVAFLDAEGDRRFGVRLTAGVRRRRAVADRPLERGDTLSAADLRREPAVTWGPPESQDSVRTGWIVRRRLRPGERLRRPAVSPPAAVKSGQRVRVLLHTGAVRVAVPGRASGTAESGEPVSVRLETGRRLRGVAAAGGVVRVENAPGGGH